MDQGLVTICHQDRQWGLDLDMDIRMIWTIDAWEEVEMVGAEAVVRVEIEAAVKEGALAAEAHRIVGNGKGDIADLEATLEVDRALIVVAGIVGMIVGDLMTGEGDHHVATEVRAEAAPLLVVAIT